MTREEKKAIAGNKYYPDDVNGYYAFLHGAEWSDKHPVNVWHDAVKEPQGDYIILCDGLDYLQWVEDYQHIDMSYANWQDYVNAFKVNRWAYISDLLPKGGER